MVGPGFFDGLYFRQLIKGGIGNGFLYRKKSLALLLVVCFLLTMITPTFVQGAAVTGNSLPEARMGSLTFTRTIKQPWAVGEKWSPSRRPE